VTVTEFLTYGGAGSEVPGEESTRRSALIYSTMTGKQLVQSRPRLFECIIEHG
jgi:hypothetical protein